LLFDQISIAKRRQIAATNALLSSETGGKLPPQIKRLHQQGHRAGAEDNVQGAIDKRRRNSDVISGSGRMVLLGW
jgi:hypothetical protein